MKNVGIAILASALLSACGSPSMRSGETFDRISQELKEAAESKRRQPAPDAVGRAMMPPLQVDEPVAARPEPRFNLAVNNAPAGQVFMALVAGTRYNMLVPPEVTGNLTLDLKDAPWDHLPGAIHYGDPSFARQLSLTDGGAYDNLGLETIDTFKTVIVSDAGAPFGVEEASSAFWPKQANASRTNNSVGSTTLVVIIYVLRYEEKLLQICSTVR